MLSSAHLPDRLRTSLLKMEITGDPTYAPGEMVYSMLDDLFLDLDHVIYEFLKSLATGHSIRCTTISQLESSSGECKVHSMASVSLSFWNYAQTTCSRPLSFTAPT